MKNLYSKTFFLTLFFTVLCTLFSLAQNKGQASWVDLIDDPNANFYDIKQSFNSYWNNRTIEKGNGYNVFKRWESYMEPRVYPNGDIKLPSKTYENYNAWLAQNNSTSSGTAKSISGTWSLLGPIGKPTGGGAGRINFIRFDPTNSNTMYVGTPDGGLWKSTDAGTSWTTNTTIMSVIGCSDIAIDPTNTQIMYLATGDGDGGDTYSIGVQKSVDGGNTWNPTGLNWNVNLGRRISKLLMDPTNSSILLAGTSSGIYRTTDAGVNWTLVFVSNIKDMEFKPGAHDTIYASGTIVCKSTDNGATWNTITSGLPTTNIQRIALAVSANNSAYVYALVGKSGGYVGGVLDQGLIGVYRSTNSGTSFTQVKDGTTPNILDWSLDGSGIGGQAFYDLSIAASPQNANEVFVGGVNQWRSTDGGVNWIINSHWTGAGGKPYVHADVHDIVFLPGSGTTLFSANDGGIFKTTNSGTTWTDLSNNLAIAQQYRIGLSTSTPNLIVAGHQDNGTNIYNGSTWNEVFGGDGMDCFIDRTNNNTIFGAYVFGKYYKSTNGGASFTDIVSGIPNGEGNADWLSVWHQDPVTAATIYAGGRPDLYKTTNSGTTWSVIGTPTGTGNIVEFAIAPSNNQVIYAIKSGANAISKSTNGGATFNSITGTLPVTALAPTNIAISNTDPNVVWITFSGYSAISKVFKSIDGGANWVNFSVGLPAIPCNTIVYTNNSPDAAVYVGTDVGVFYRDNTMTSWISYSSNLPRVAVRDLEIYYPTGRLRAATYGRGTWDSDLYTYTPVAPIANFQAIPITLCPGSVASFTNTSTGTPTSYSWSFVGGTPNSSTALNPVITYTTPGTYTVALTASNAVGSHTSTQTNLIVVLNPVGNTPPLTEGFTGAFPPNGWSLVNTNASTTTWAKSATVGLSPTSGNSMFFDNFSYNDIGSKDEIRLVALNLQTYTTAILTFNVAYAPFNATNFDGLEVLVDKQCLTSFTSVYIKTYTDLATMPATTLSFVPTQEQWRTEIIDLTSYVGMSNVTIAFKNLAGFGNVLYLDNINVSNAPAPNTIVTGTINGSPFCEGTSGISVPYTITGTYTAGNVFTAQLSDEFGSFAAPTILGTLSSINAGTIVTTTGLPAVAGTKYRIRVVSSNPVVIGTYNGPNLTINLIPTIANAGSNQLVCTNSATLAANNPTVGTGQWSLVSGSGLIASSAVNNSTISALGLGNNVFRWTIGNSGCVTTTSDVTIMYNELPTVSNAGINQEVCGSNTTLLGNPAYIGTSVWSLVSGAGSITNTTLNNSTVTALGLGNNVFKWTITNFGCPPSISDVTITRTSGSTLPYTQNFEGGVFPPAGWATYSADEPQVVWGVFGTKQWELRAAPGNSGSTAGCAAINCFNYSPDAGQKDYLQSNPINLSGYSSATLTFKTSYAVFSAIYTDTLKVRVSTDCGNTYSPALFSKGGTELRPTYVTTTSYTPSLASDWSIHTIDLTAFAGQPILLSFESINGWGNNIYLDDINVVGNPATNTITTGVISGSPFCAGTTGIAIPYTKTGTFISGNIFTAQLSDAFGSFASTTNLGTLSTTSNGTLITNIGLPNIAGTEYRIRIVSSNPSVFGTDNGFNLTINSSVTPSISINTETPNICAGTTATFTATSTDIGGITSYQWKVNGTNAGTNATTFVSTFNNGQQVSCIMTSNPTCATSFTATSNSITINESGTLSPNININISTQNICTGTTATLTATPTNGGSMPGYQWKVNGVNAGTNSSTFVSTFNNADQVTCVLTSSLACANPLTATSNIVTVTVSGTLVPSVSITTTASTICAGTTSTFTATPINAGTNPNYQWKINGVNAGLNAPTFVSTFSNGNKVSCVVTSNFTCANPLSSTSNIITITITNNLIPGISINTTTPIICAGATATFAATPSNAGASPTYQWKINGVNAGTNSATFASTFNNSDQVNCVITSNATCTSPLTATSNNVIITIGSSITYFLDTDNDGLGNPLNSVSGCNQPIGYVTNSNDCDDNNNSIGALSVSYILSFTNICSIANSVKINTGTPGGGIYSGTGIVGTNFNPSGLTGTIVITYTKIIGTCSESVTQTIIVDNCTSIEEIASSTVTIYPNPLQNDLFIEIESAKSKEYLVEIFSIIGQVIYNEKIETSNGNSTTKVDLKDVANGIYIVNLSSEEETITKRIIINK
ncbi:MAG: PKD domain-containing protein [Bacteroidota bacterium]